MKHTSKPSKPYPEYEEIPQYLNETEVLNWISTRNITWSYLHSLKSLGDFSDELLSDWLNISVRSFRSYKQSQAPVSINLKEHLLLLISLIKHGNAVFGSRQDFAHWISTPNFHFEQKAPGSFLNTITGIRFVDDRLTALQYGDNV
jgi:uncharacterized protein (DUF2384 family)